MGAYTQLSPNAQPCKYMTNEISEPCSTLPPTTWGRFRRPDEGGLAFGFQLDLASRSPLLGPGLYQYSPPQEAGPGGRLPCDRPPPPRLGGQTGLGPKVFPRPGPGGRLPCDRPPPPDLAAKRDVGQKSSHGQVDDSRLGQHQSSRQPTARPPQAAEPPPSRRKPPTW